MVIEAHLDRGRTSGYRAGAAAPCGSVTRWSLMAARRMVDEHGEDVEAAVAACH